MNKKLLITVLILFLIPLLTYGEKKGYSNELVGFQGEWLYSEGEEYGFFIYLEQEGDKIRGGYSAVVGKNGRRIDGIPGESENISGIIEGDVAEITFKSDWGGIGKAKITPKGNQIEWEIIKGTEKGKFLCPYTSVLNRQNGKAENE